MLSIMNSRLAGIVYPDVLQMNVILSPMLETMRSGLKPVKEIHTHKNIQLGTIGAPLLFNEKKTLVAALDGEIENYKELEKELGASGPKAILLAAYDKWQEKCLEKLDGSFAFALYDTAREQLLLARDRIGKKPLYWYHDQHHLIFGSEIKSLLASGLVPQTPALDAIAMYLYFGFIPQDLSPIKEVSKLLPASYLLYQPKKGRSIRQYWSYSHFFEKKEPYAGSFASLLERGTEKLLTAREKTVGCFVTGGLGSASVAWEVKRLAKEKEVLGYSVGFKGQTEEDTRVAAKVASTLQIPLRADFITPKNVTDDLVSIIWNLDEPIADPNNIATWKLCQMAREETETIFSGMGSDEILAGHSRYQTPGPTSGLHLFPTRLLVPLINLFSPSMAFHMLKRSRTDPWQFEFLKQNALFSPELLKAAAPMLAHFLDPDTFLHKFHHMSRIGSPIAQLLYIDVKTRLPDHFMLQYERLTKAHGLTWQTPFLDRELIEFTAGLTEPGLLKQLVSPIFPSDIVNRPKQSRPDFLTPWATLPEIHALFKMLLNGTLLDSGLISEPWLREQLSSTHVAPHSFRLLWSLLTLETWFQLFINRPIRATPITHQLHELLQTSTRSAP